MLFSDLQREPREFHATKEFAGSGVDHQTDRRLDMFSARAVFRTDKKIDKTEMRYTQP